jgi:hypothetical protein
LRLEAFGFEEEMMSKNKSGRNSENAADTAQREREQAGQKQKDEGERRRQNSDFVPGAESE